MNDTPLTLEQIEALAATIGLCSLSRQQLEQLQKVTNAKRAQDVASLTRGLTPEDEPACIFTLDSPGTPAEPTA